MEETLLELWALHFIYLKQSASALVPVTICVVIHALGIGFARSFYRRFELLGRHFRAFGCWLVVVGVVAIMLVTHWVEVLAWGWFYLLMGILPKGREAVLFSVNAYTTLGSSGITLPHEWQGVSAFEAMTAMLMFGWSTAILAVIVQKLHSVDE